MPSILQKLIRAGFRAPREERAVLRRLLFSCGFSHHEEPRLAQPPDYTALRLVAPPPKPQAAGEIARHNRRFVQLLKDRGWIREVEIHLEDNPCPPCRREARSVRVDLLPVLPHLLCKRPEGCGCWYGVPQHIARRLRREPPSRRSIDPPMERAG